jgi:hypothetical protein
MENIVQIILVNHNPQISNEILKGIHASGILCQVKNVLNGGHALLHLFHLHLYDRINRGKILILLNLHTPVVDGFEFLKEFGLLKDFKKEHICIAVINNELNQVDKSKAQDLGVLNFLPSSLCPEFLRNLISPGINTI